MTPDANPSAARRFSVHGADVPAAHGCLVEGDSFESAALLYLEHRHLAVTDDEEVQLFVEDCETGERHCFRVDLDSGETASCD